VELQILRKQHLQAHRRLLDPDPQKKTPSRSKRFIATITPLPAHPTPGSGPPDSTHPTSPYPVNSISSVDASFLIFKISSIVGISYLIVCVWCLLWDRILLPAHFLSVECAAAMLETIVDFPIPPFHRWRSSWFYSSLSPLHL